MMMGRVGRADNGLNCAGRHGLTRYTASIAKITCNFCGNMNPGLFLDAGQGYARCHGVFVNGAL